MQFFLPMYPPTCTAQQHRVVARGKGKPAAFFDSPALADARAKLTANLAQHRPDTPLNGPIRLTVKWCFPATGKHKDGDWKVTKPDTDNLQKLLKDVMTRAGFWVDDARVCSEIVEKFWADVPGIWIRIETL